MNKLIAWYAEWLLDTTFYIGNTKRGGPGNKWGNMISKLSWYHNSGEPIPDIYMYLLYNLRHFADVDRNICTKIIIKCIKENEKRERIYY